MKATLLRKIIILTLSFCVGFLAVSLFNSQDILLSTDSVTYKKITLLEEEMGIINAETKLLEEQLKELTEELQNAEIKLDERTSLVDDLTSQLENYQIISGEHDVIGMGVTIDIKEPETEGPFQVSLVQNYYYLLGILSNLNSAGAEAISINDQRYSAYTEIVPVSDFLNINGKFVAPPIQIKAIGDPRTLNAAVNFLGGVVEQMRTAGFEVVVTESEEIIINGLDSRKEFEYAEPYVVENIQ